MWHHAGVIFAVIYCVQAQQSQDCNVSATEPCGELGACIGGKCYCSEGSRHDKFDTGCILNPTSFAVYKSLCFLGCLLLLGKSLRIMIPAFQATFLPASIIAGLFFFTVLQVMQIANPTMHKTFTHEFTEGWSKIAPFAVDVLFASLFLGTTIPPMGDIVRKAGPQFIYNQVLNWGLWITVSVVCLVICVPIFGSNPLLATLVPVGFTGGHSIAVTLSENYFEEGFDDALGLGLYIATVGQIMSFVLGVYWINRAQKLGMLKARPDFSNAEDTTERDLFAKGLFAADAMPSAGKQTVSPDSLDVLTLHAGVVMLAMLIGVTLTDTMAPLIAPVQISRFVWCMFVGIILQLFYEKLVRCQFIPPLLDSAIMSRLQGFILDFLIVSAMSTVDVRNVLGQLIPATIASAAGLAWMGFCTWYIAPHMLPNHEFERAIGEYGQTTGVISSGLILLKMCDPQQKLQVVMDSFTLKNFAAMPFLFTILPQTIPLVASAWGLLKIIGFSGALLLAATSVWYFKYRPEKQRAQEMERTGEVVEDFEVTGKSAQQRSEDFTSRSMSFS